MNSVYYLGHREFGIKGCVKRGVYIMSTKSVVEFYDKAFRDDKLREKLKIVNENTISEKLFEELILPEAKKLGYDFSYDDVIDYYHPKEKVELSINQLESVSGGGCSYSPINGDLVETAKNCKHYKGGSPESCRNCNNAKCQGGVYYCKY